MALRDDIRAWVLMQGRSQRSAAKHFGVSRDLVAALLREPAEGTQRRYPCRKARLAPARERILPHIEGWLKENEGREREEEDKILVIRAG